MIIEVTSLHYDNNNDSYLLDFVYSNIIDINKNVDIKYTVYKYLY